MASDLTLAGYDAILQRLSTFQQDMQDRISKAALRAGAKVIKESIQEEVSVSTKNEVHIRDDIKVGAPVRTETGWKIKIGPGKKTAWRAKFVEFGHMKLSGGQVPAHPFMEPGLSRSKQNFMSTVADVVRREL